MPTEVDAALLRTLPLPQPSDDDDKDRRGRVLVVAGSVEVPGAALLAGVAAGLFESADALPPIPVPAGRS